MKNFFRIFLGSQAALVAALISSDNAFAQNAYCWINSATGSPVPNNDLFPGGTQHDVSDPNNAHIPRVLDSEGKPHGGVNFVRVPCPPTATQTSMSGLYIGGELAKNWGRVRSIESLATTDVITNRFSDSGDPIGGGIVAGYNFRPWANNILIGPFASFDGLHQTINHNFAGGQYLGTATHWSIDAGVKAGVLATPGLYLYGLAGAAFLNHDLNVNFATAASTNTTTPGFTLGAGGEYQVGALPSFGTPVSVFVQYQHTWWSNANFTMPASSPAFNYAFKRQDDTIKLGVNFYLSPSLLSAAPPLVAKY